jgi:two-component system, OmpR family, sensor kinase
MNTLAGRLLLAFALVILVGSTTTVFLAGRGTAIEIRHMMEGSMGLEMPMMGGRGADGEVHVMELPVELLVVRVNRAVWLAAIAAGGVAFALALLLLRTIAAPLARVAAAAAEVAGGDMAARAPVQGPWEVRQVADTFNGMATTLARQEELRRAMLADVAHELRTPITVMQGQLEALTDGIFPLTPQSLEPVHAQTLHLARLVEDLRTLAHAEADQLALERMPAALPALACDLLASFAPQAQGKGILLVNALPADLPLIDADLVRLRQVLSNLLSNALRHTPKGGRVTLAAHADKDAVVIMVSDTGEGIPPEELPHVFERFYRADRSRTRSTGGSGLGLSIARRLTEAHGGDISLRSEIGHGTTVLLRWPLAS